MLPYLRTVLCLSAVIIAGCGGWSDGSRSAAEPELSNRTFEGRAAKGLILDGVVEAFEYSDGIWVLVSVGRTDDAGDFDIDLSMTTGPVKVVVSADASTQMICDNPIACADDYSHPLFLGTLDSGDQPFFMMTIIPAGQAGGQLAVTPVTHLAASLIDSLPDGAPISDGLIQLAFQRAAEIFGLAPDFAWHLPIDVTDPDQLGNASSVQHALLSAAFIQGSAELALVLSLEDYASRFVELAGQLNIDAGDGTEPSLGLLVSQAEDIAVQLLEGDQLASITAALNDLVAQWGVNPLTQATGQINIDGSQFDQAVVLLDHMDYYLGLAGINADGTFFSEQVPQINWLYKEEAARLDTQGMLVVMYEAAVNTAIASVMLSAADPAAACEPFSGIAFGSQPAGYMTFCAATSELIISTVGSGEAYLGQHVTMTISLTPANQLLAGELVSYGLSANLMNMTAVASAEGVLSLMVGTELGDLLESIMVDGATVSVEDLLAVLEVSAEIAGEGTLSAVADPEWSFSGAIVADGSISVPRLNAGGPLLLVNIEDGYLNSPLNDRLAALTDDIFCGVSDPSPPLHLSVGDQAQAEACFEFEAFGMPAMKVVGNGELTGIGDFIAGMLEWIPSLLSGETLDIGSMLGSLDASLLSLAGGVTLEVAGHQHADDFSWVEQRRYLFAVDNNRLDASLEGSSASLSFYLTGFQGGYLFSGDTFIGTVTFDWTNIGFSVYLVNGETRHYLLGPLTDLLEPELAALLTGFLDQLAGSDGGDSGGDGDGSTDPGGLM